MRFQGFEGEWAASSLSSFCKKITRKNKGNQISNVLCNSANHGIIPQSEYFDREIANSDNTEGYYVIENGDFVYNPRKSTAAPYGPVNIYRGKDLGIISPLYLCFQVDSLDPDFLNFRFKSHAWHQYMYENGDSGARHDRVSIKDEVFFAMPISFPTKAEQKKIVSFLTLLEERIAIQNKVIEDLKKLKTALCEKLISKGESEGSTLFSLGEEGEFIRGFSYNSSEISEFGTCVLRSNNLMMGESINYCDNVVFVSKKPKGQQLLQKGDIVICMANGSSQLLGKSSYYDGDYNGVITAGAFCGIYRSSSPLIRWLFWTKEYSRKVQGIIQGGNGAIANLHGEDILGISFNVPDDSVYLMTLCKSLSGIQKKQNLESEFLNSLLNQKQHILTQLFI